MRRQAACRRQPSPYENRIDYRRLAAQVNGVVTTLVELVRGLQAASHGVEVIHPGLFKTRPCPGYAGIDLVIRPARGLAENWMRLKPT